MPNETYEILELFYTQYAGVENSAAGFAIWNETSQTLLPAVYESYQDADTALSEIQAND